MRKYKISPAEVSIGTAVIFVAFVIFSFVLVSTKVGTFIKGMPVKIDNSLKDHHGNYVNISNISIYVQDAAISSQDERFYKNWGIDLKGTVRAIYYSLATQKRQGASTITEQLAKNVYFNDKDNFETDLETKILALYITKTYSKKKILEMYLNEIYFGKQAYGISSASKAYFGTNPDKLSIAQSAYLLGLIDAPSYLQGHQKQASKAAVLVLEQMEKLNYISAKNEQQAVIQINSGHFSL